MNYKFSVLISIDMHSKVLTILPGSDEDNEGKRFTTKGNVNISIHKNCNSF